MKIPEGLITFRLTPKRSLIAALVAASLTFLTVRCGISQEDLLKWYNEIRKTIKLDLPDENNILNEIDRQLNERINKNPELLDFKIRREVDDAIGRYERLTGDYGNVRIPTPRYSENLIDSSVCYSDDCKALGGEMRLCSPWSPDCPDTSQPVTKDLTENSQSAILNEWSGNQPSEP